MLLQLTKAIKTSDYSNTGATSCREKRADQKETTEFFVAKISFGILTLRELYGSSTNKTKQVHRTLIHTVSSRFSKNSERVTNIRSRLEILSTVTVSSHSGVAVASPAAF